MVTQTDGNPPEKGVSPRVANHPDHLDAEANIQPIEADESKPAAPPSGLWGHLCHYGYKVIVAGRVELQGITPIPVKERTVTKTLNIFTLWWSMSCNILPITFGMLGPVYGLNLRDSCLIILFFTLLSTIPPAYLCTWGPKLGMRQMIQARYSWGRYIVSLPVLLNLATTTGFSVIIVITGGQCLSAVANGHLSISVGIVIMSILTLIISFCGYTTLHMYERFAWIPAVIAIIVAVGCGGKYLHLQNPPSGPPSPQGILSFAMIVSSYMIPWACLSSDFTTYLVPSTPSWKIFVYSYTGLGLPTILLMCLGAAIGGAIPSVPEWSEAYDQTLVGGVLQAMLAPAGGFGRFLVVILSFTLLGNLAATSYSITLNFQMLAPVLFKVPRYLFAIILAAILIPVGIKASANFYDSLENFVSLIGYWCSAFLGVVMVDHLWEKKGDCGRYDLDAWNDASKLPWGIAALTAAVASFGLVIPSMDQVWWQGPIAKTTGDLGFEFAFFVSGLLYVPLRMVEKKVSGR
ncbi:permease for cytosine/purines, uracil, thiamine, allantoin-domain-containing protein [Pseudoneurospora amorphoporcata]|uniref:Permease for cytosine/purines, uracil, thiamine, allantoin-domain-containing protein n=1 Tax=Pseudoneurospora amorphoporcata TaxID=241081 RepID=A0AAN6SC75_9PEZI|nr:permease for cytosine/purines, uracil, thiamine, allantoin-domain-containing protein [Pseudoneurospora amorphoporcata]